ncbi:MAG: hypothetical protein K1X35_06970 [Caulobacteraceae bacterium]|nr:hypothetical protein [Caulobacteraceae bacterium]
MTDDQIQSVKDDIAFMRALAAEGQRTPLLGGSILAAAGLIFGVASLAYWALLTGILQLPHGWGSFGIWMGALAIFFGVLAVLNRRIGGKPGARSPANKASGAAWSAVGFSIFALALGYGFAGWRLQSEDVMMTFPSVIFALYGAGWAVASAMSAKKWLWWVALGSWAMSPVLGWFAGQDALYLVYAAGLFGLTLIPGVVLLRQEPSDIV